MEFRDTFSWKSQISNLTEIRSVGAALLRANRRADITKVVGGFRDYENAPKNKHFTRPPTYFFLYVSRIYLDKYFRREKLLVEKVY
jgi:hypothetical protein